MARCKKTLRWHPAFYAGMQIELQEDAGRLEFKAEHTLGSEPVRVDLLIIKKTDDRPLKKRIGKIFRTHNIVEYKSPGHSLTIDAFYKACGYVNLYKAATGGEDEIKIILMHKLAEEESRWLRSLTNRMTETVEINRLLENYEGHKDNPLYRTVMDVIVRANWKKFEEV